MLNSGFGMKNMAAMIQRAVAREPAWRATSVPSGIERLFDPSPVITHTFPMQQIDDALAAIRSGEAGKVILEIGGSA